MAERRRELAASSFTIMLLAQSGKSQGSGDKVPGRRVLFSRTVSGDQMSLNPSYAGDMQGLGTGRHSTCLLDGVRADDGGRKKILTNFHNSLLHYLLE